LAESPANHTQRLAKVGVIEEIEYFCAKLDDLVLTQLGSFNDREVYVVETWTDYDVSAKTARSTGWRRHEWSWVKPAVDSIEIRDRPSYIRSQCVVCSGEERVVDYDRNGVTGLKLDYGAKLPALCQLVSMERQFIETAEYEAMTGIEI
jgi:hypothetical protein